MQALTQKTFSLFIFSSFTSNELLRHVNLDGLCYMYSFITATQTDYIIVGFHSREKAEIKMETF